MHLKYFISDYFEFLIVAIEKFESFKVSGFPDLKNIRKSVEDMDLGATECLNSSHDSI